MSKIFLSHNHEDKPLVRRIKRLLNNAGFETWIDEDEIKVGESLLHKIIDGIYNTEFLIAIISPNSINSHWVNFELEKAMYLEVVEKKLVILPIILSDCQVPRFLVGKKYLKLSNIDDFKAHENELLKAVGYKGSLDNEASFSDLSFVSEDKNPSPSTTIDGVTYFKTPIYRIKTMWTVHYPYIGMKFSRKWYIEGNFRREMSDVYDSIWDNKDGKMASYIYNRNGNPPGNYSGRLFIEGKYQCSGNFVITSQDKYFHVEGKLSEILPPVVEDKDDE
jgi:hypothetical protein